MSAYQHLFKHVARQKAVPTLLNSTSSSASKFTLSNHNQQIVATQNVRYLSGQPANKGFFGGFLDNLKEEYNKNKEMKDSISKFREEAAKLEQSESLQEARKKYKELENETGKNSQVLKEKMEEFSGKLKESDFGKNASKFGEDFSEKAKQAAEQLSKQTADMSQTQVFRTVSATAGKIKENIDDATQLSQVQAYKKPVVLRKRSELDEAAQQKIYEENTTDTGMELHKDSKFYQSWENFKDNNQYVNKLFEFKTQYDESDNPLVRATRSVTEKFTSMFGGMFKSTEMSEVLTEIIKVDPTFDLAEFLKQCQHDIIPNILEALSQGELEILKDWCTEASYNIMTHPITQCEHLKMVYNNEILDINQLEIAGAKIMDQGPVLILTFTAQQILYVSNKDGKVIEGDKDKIKRINHIWVLARDQSIMDPSSAWRLMECASHQTDMFV